MGASIRQPDSVEASLLELIDLPPHTPIVGLPKPPAPPAPAQSHITPIQRTPIMPESSAVPEYGDDIIDTTYTVSRQAPPAQSSQPTYHAPAAPLVSREAEMDTANASGQTPENTGQSNSEKPDSDANVDKLAREVYRRLRGKLRIEQERRTDKS
jgi:hypothetical protein